MVKDKTNNSNRKQDKDNKVKELRQGDYIKHKITENK